MKKHITLLLTLVMLITSFTVCSAARFSDTTGTNFETPVEVLSALGIVQGKTADAYEPTKTLTRAEMTAIIMRSLGMATSPIGEKFFKDVSETHWASGYIAAAYKMGIINGLSAESFAPEMAVTYEQAVKMVVVALGYGVKAEAAGGYPTGYLTVAAQLDLLKGVTVGGSISRGDMAVLMYNALEVPHFKSGYGDDAYSYNADPDETILSALKVEKAVAKVVQTATECMTDAPEQLKKGEVRISDGAELNLVMQEGLSRASSHFGVRANIYYREDTNGGQPIVLSVVPHASAKVLEIPASAVTASTTRKKLVYKVNGEYEEADIEGATLVYNGRKRSLAASFLMPETGKLRLVADQGTEYSLIVVESYKNYVIDSIVSTSDRVNFKHDQGYLTLDLDGNKPVTVLTDAAGTPYTLQELTEWMVISVAEDNDTDPSVRRCYISTDTVAGKITELSETPAEIVVGEKAYPVTMDMSELSVGMEATYRLDFTGAVADATVEMGTTRTYGWLKSASRTPDIKKEPQLKIFTEQGEWKTFKLAEILQYNGSSIKAELLFENGAPAELLYADDMSPTLVDAEGNVVPQLLAYKTDDKGVIQSIETAVNKSNTSNSIMDKMGGDFSLDFYANINHKSAQFTGDKTGIERPTSPSIYDGPANSPNRTKLSYTDSVFGVVRVSELTKFFDIPTDPDNEAGYKAYTSAKAVFNDNMLKSDAGKCQAFYDVSDSLMCGVIVRRKDLWGSAVEDNTGGSLENRIEWPDEFYDTVGVVSKISNQISEDGFSVNTVITVSPSSGAATNIIIEEEDRIYYNGVNTALWEDPDWYVLVPGENETDPPVEVRPGDDGWMLPGYEYDEEKPWENSVFYESPESKFGRTRVKNIFIDAKDITVGDVIKYKYDAEMKMSHCAMWARADYPSGLEMGFKENYTPATHPDANYIASAFGMSGTIVKVVGEEGILIETGLSETHTKALDKIVYPDEDNNSLVVVSGVPAGVTVYRWAERPSSIYIYDKRAGTMKWSNKITDLMVGDKVFSAWRSYSHQLLVVYR